MLKVLRNVALAGLEPLLWHLDREGLQDFGAVGTAAVRSDGVCGQQFMNVPIDPVARCGGDWTLDVAFGISIRGEWPTVAISDMSPLLDLRGAGHTIN